MQLSFLRAVKAHAILLLSFLLLFTTGCEDDDHDDHDETHINADGFVLLDSNSIEKYKELQGITTGTIELELNDTLELSVLFLDSSGTIIMYDDDHDDHDDYDYYDDSNLAISNYDTSIVTIEVESYKDEECHEDHHDEDEDYDHDDDYRSKFHIIGLSSGSTSFTLQLMHDGHADYTSTNDVVVNVN
jgi:hypothetical protein